MPKKFGNKGYPSGFASPITKGPLRKGDTWPSPGNVERPAPHDPLGIVPKVKTGYKSDKD